MLCGNGPIKVYIPKYLSIYLSSTSPFAPTLAFIINLSFRSGMFPNDWKTAKVVPLHKSGPSDTFGNYRPISILPIVSKIIEKIVHNRLIAFLNKHDLLSKSQFGFRAKRSTELAVTLLCDQIRRNADNKMLTGCIFIDLSKAFDTLSHAKLLLKLSAYGIANTELEWFTDYLFNRKQIVNYNNVSSDAEYVTCGVPQGSILGPLLFIIFANDVADYVQYSEIIKYADDTVLYVAGKSIEIIESYFSSDLNGLATWLEENELILNLNKGKTEVMLCGTGKRLSTIERPLNVMYKQSCINITTTYKYLGVNIDPSLTLNDYFNNCYKKATGRLHLLNRLRSQLDIKAATAIYQSLIVPVMTYCSLLTIFATNTQINRLRSFDNRARKIICRDADVPNSITLPSIESIKKRHACMFVRKCISNDTCENFCNYFEVLNHEKQTRNKNCSIRLPPVRTEFARKSVYFSAAKLFNALPADIRQLDSTGKFKNGLKSHFL